jgi:predicted metal-dependent enzyme (double-stranded beta helix superfamily)
MLTLSSLADTVTTVAGDPRLWRQHVHFDSGSRYWHRLATLPDADLWLLTWLPDQQTDLHDHGEATAAFTLVSGSLEEVRVSNGRRVSRSLAPGQVSWVPAGAVHDVGNRGGSPAISIHAYSPRLTEMTFWDLDDGSLRRVSTVLTDEPEVA